MAEFADLNARLTGACKTRLGELVDVTLPNRKTLVAVRAIVDRNRELIGENGQVSDIRMTAKLARSDVGVDLVGGEIFLGEDEHRRIDAVVGDDGQFIEVTLR